jgi:hypothetical protein
MLHEDLRERAKRRNKEIHANENKLFDFINVQ